MKNNYSIFSILLVSLISLFCGDDSSKQTNTETQKKPPLSQNPVYVQGLKLVADNGCYTCHKIDERLAGPSYKEIAQKYTSQDIDYLSNKIIKGGKGVWGEIPMIPHPNISQKNAEEIVNYILLLSD